MSLKRLLLIGLLLFTAACGDFGLPIPRLVFETPTPRLPPGPTATPLPSTIVNFTVRIPPNTPAGAAVAVQIIDEVTGAQTNVPLTNTGANLWAGGAAATADAVLRYRYLRIGAGLAPEVTAVRQPIAYRLYLVPPGNALVEDTVAAWEDTPFAGDLGAIAGVVRNSSTGAGVTGVLVSAAGQSTLTHGDGTFTLINVPVGNQTVTALAPDGALRPAQALASVPSAQFAAVELAAPDPNAVHVTFVVRPPAGTDPLATFRLIGNVAQLGDTFAPNSSGSAVSAARAPVLTPLGDGRWAARVLLYQGTVLRYAYSLGDGVWNSELDSFGSKRLRSYVVPWADAIVEDTVESWHTGTSAAVMFELTTPGNTPPNDLVSIQFRSKDWLPALPMWRANLNQWRFVLYNPTNFDGSLNFRFCRNLACGSADDVATSEATALSRAFTPTLLPQTLKETVVAWRWLGEAVPVSAVLPPPTARAAFSAGADLPEAWQPQALPFYPETIRSLEADAANALTILRRSSLVSINPPIYADDVALTMPAFELSTLASLARSAGLGVTVHPVTCAYTPYGACDYWSGAPFGDPNFWNAWFAAYERYLLTQADAANQASANVLVVGDFKLRPSFPGEPEAPPEAEARWRDLLAKVRTRFRGQLAFELLMGQSVWPNPPQFLDSVDVIRLFWWAPLSASAAPEVNDMTTNAGALLDTHALPLQQRFGKPLRLSLAYYAADGASTQCLLRPDGQCHAFTDFEPGAPDVARYPLDLAEQADVYNALLSAVNARPWISGVSAFGYNPVAALRDKSLSVRGKPAETILAAWFLRFQGR
jgi:hypothetical protein